MFIIIIKVGVQAVLVQYELFTEPNTRDHLAWTILLLLFALKQSFSMRQSMILKDQNTRDHSAWTIGNAGIPDTGCVSHTGYLAHGNSIRVKQE